MQNKMQNLATRIMKDETVGHVPNIYNNLPTNQGSAHKCNTLCDYTHTGSSGKEEVTLVLS
jgi:hypothetical protein